MPTLASFEWLIFLLLGFGLGLLELIRVRRSIARDRAERDADKQD